MTPQAGQGPGGRRDAGPPATPRATDLPPQRAQAGGQAPRRGRAPQPRRPLPAASARLGQAPTCHGSPPRQPRPGAAEEAAAGLGSPRAVPAPPGGRAGRGPAALPPRPPLPPQRPSPALREEEAAGAPSRRGQPQA